MESEDGTGTGTIPNQPGSSDMHLDDLSHPFSSCKKVVVSDHLSFLLEPRIKLSFFFGCKNGWKSNNDPSQLKSTFINFFRDPTFFQTPINISEKDIYIRYLNRSERASTLDHFVPSFKGSVYFRPSSPKPRDRMLIVRNNLLKKVCRVTFHRLYQNLEFRAFVPLSEDPEEMISLSKLSSGVLQEPPTLVIKQFPLHLFVDEPDSRQPSEPFLRVFFESFGNIRTLEVKLDEIFVQYSSCHECREALMSLCLCSLLKEGTDERYEYKVMLKEDFTEECTDNKRQLEKQHYVLNPEKEETKVLRQLEEDILLKSLYKIIPQNVAESLDTP